MLSKLFPDWGSEENHYTFKLFVLVGVPSILMLLGMEFSQFDSAVVYGVLALCSIYTLIYLRYWLFGWLSKRIKKSTIVFYDNALWLTASFIWLILGVYLALEYSWYLLFLTFYFALGDYNRFWIGVKVYRNFKADKNSDPSNVP